MVGKFGACLRTEFPADLANVSTGRMEVQASRLMAATNPHTYTHTMVLHTAPPQTPWVPLQDFSLLDSFFAFLVPDFLDELLLRQRNLVFWV